MKVKFIFSKKIQNNETLFELTKIYVYVWHKIFNLKKVKTQEHTVFISLKQWKF